MAKRKIKEVPAAEFTGGFFRESKRHKWRLCTNVYKIDNQVILCEYSCRQFIFDKDEKIQTK